MLLSTSYKDDLAYTYKPDHMGPFNLLPTYLEQSNSSAGHKMRDCNGRFPKIVVESKGNPHTVGSRVRTMPKGSHAGGGLSAIAGFGENR